MSLVKIQGNVSGTGTLTIAAPNTNSNYTLDLPANSGTITTTASTPTFTGAVTAPSFIPNGSSAPTNGLYLPAANSVGIATNSSERVRVDSSGNVGIGVTPSAWISSARALQIGARMAVYNDGSNNALFSNNSYYDGSDNRYIQTAAAARYYMESGGTHIWQSASSGTAGDVLTFTERARITSGGSFYVGKTVGTLTVAGAALVPDADNEFSFTLVNGRSSGGETIIINRQNSDGTLIQFRQANTTEGDISVSGTTVSYNGGHLSRYAQTQAPKDDTLLKGTVLSNLDEMNVYINPETGEPVPNEQLNKVKVSDVEGDVNVAGVFVNWTYDEQHFVDEINMAMTGDMIIRIAQGVVVQKGDLLMSAGDGTAKPQGDDIVRSKTVAKVTSNHVTCTYEDGSYCVPCVLMAC